MKITNEVIELSMKWLYLQELRPTELPFPPIIKQTKKKVTNFLIVARIMCVHAILDRNPLIT